MKYLLALTFLFWLIDCHAPSRVTTDEFSTTIYYGDQICGWVQQEKDGRWYVHSWSVDQFYPDRESTTEALESVDSCHP